MNSRTTRRFRELFAALPAHVRRQARESYRLFRQDPTHPGLHFKPVHTDPPLYSARVGINYRAVGIRDGNTLVWYWIGSHAAYDQLLSQLSRFLETNKVSRVDPEPEQVFNRLLIPFLRADETYRGGVKGQNASP